MKIIKNKGELAIATARRNVLTPRVGLAHPAPDTTAYAYRGRGKSNCARVAYRGRGVKILQFYAHVLMDISATNAANKC